MNLISERILQSLQSEKSLAAGEIQSFLRALFDGEIPEAQAADVLTRWSVRGETGADLAAAADFLRRQAIVVEPKNRPLTDTCGTGGDGGQTLNVSTLSALVVAAAGGAVAKHGNRSVSGKTGSADVVEFLGLPLQVSAKIAARLLEETGFVFLFAPVFHPALAKIGPLRRKIGRRTLFNCLGPLLNPAKPEFQIVGVSEARLLEPIHFALCSLGLKKGAVVHSSEGWDEVSPFAATQIRTIDPKGGSLQNAWEPTTLLPETRRSEVRYETREKALEEAMRVIQGKGHPVSVRFTALNAGWALWASGLSQTPEEGTLWAEEIIQSKKVWQKIEQIRAAAKAMGL